MQLNPIVKKDIKVQSRSMRICFSVFGYELILALVFFIAMMIIEAENRYSTSNIYQSMANLYPVLGVAQLCILGVIVPIRTASAISGEKERQTFDIMMTTAMTPFSVVMGKVTSAIIQSMFFVIASMPIMALVFIIGGLSWGYLFLYLGLALLASFFAASIGIFCSSLCKKTISAVIMAYGFYLIFFVGTFIPLICTGVLWSTASNYGAGELAVEVSLLVLLMNPAILIVEFFVQLLGGSSFVSGFRDLLSNNGTNVFDPMYYLTQGKCWLVVSTVVFILVSLFFLWMAALRINPVRRRNK